MNIPAQYQWLAKLKGLPNTIKIGLSHLGVQEVVGKGSNRTILCWRDVLNQKGAKIEGFSDDDIPWCGLFAAWVVMNRVNNPGEVVKQPLWARNWMKYGIKAPAPMLGDILVFERGSGGHVGFYVGEDKTSYHVLGGNQSNRVCIIRIAKNRLLGARRPPYLTKPSSVKPYWLESKGTLSLNES